MHAALHVMKLEIIDLCGDLSLTILLDPAGNEVVVLDDDDAPPPPRPAKSDPLPPPDCPVCLERLPSGEVHLLVSCGHPLCYVCLGKHVRHNKHTPFPAACPLCRVNLTPAEVKGGLTGRYDRLAAAATASAPGSRRKQPSPDRYPPTTGRVPKRRRPTGGGL